MSYIPAAEKAIAFIEDHIREDICVEQVASLAGFSNPRRLLPAPSKTTIK